MSPVRYVSTGQLYCSSIATGAGTAGMMSTHNANDERLLWSDIFMEPLIIRGTHAGYIRQCRCCAVCSLYQHIL